MLNALYCYIVCAKPFWLNAYTLTHTQLCESTENRKINKQMQYTAITRDRQLDMPFNCNEFV